MVNQSTIEELAKDLKFKSQAASEYINSQIREETFMKQLQFFTPMLQGIAQFNPALYKKYFFRWMRMAGEVMEIRGFKYLIPSEAEMVQMSPEQMQGMTQNVMQTLRSGEAPGIQSQQGSQATDGQQPSQSPEHAMLASMIGGEG